jgi:hypothetical protein
MYIFLHKLFWHACDVTWMLVGFGESSPKWTHDSSYIQRNVFFTIEPYCTVIYTNAITFTYNHVYMYIYIYIYMYVFVHPPNHQNLSSSFSLFCRCRPYFYTQYLKISLLKEVPGFPTNFEVLLRSSTFCWNNYFFKWEYLKLASSTSLFVFRSILLKNPGKPTGGESDLFSYVLYFVLSFFPFWKRRYFLTTKITWSSHVQDLYQKILQSKTNYSCNQKQIIIPIK